MTIRKHYLDDAIDPWASRYIRGKVRQMIRYQGFSRQEREDLYHDFAADLLQRQPNFDPSVATWEAFVVVVCENCFANILAHRNAVMRSEQSEDGSLDTPVVVEERVLPFGATLPDSQRSAHTRRTPRPADEASELHLDVAAMIAALPPCLRELCELLKHQSLGDAARAVGRHRSTVHDAIRKLRTLFEAAGFRDYL